MLGTVLAGSQDRDKQMREKERKKENKKFILISFNRPK
jgi:hypothetical protein